MPRPSTTTPGTTTLRLLGAFAIEVSAERSAAPAVRSRRARALLAYLAMKPDGRAGREELATLLWGDNPDAQARHSLRQCLSSLRQDLHRVTPDLIDMGREAITLNAEGLVVDARELVSLATSPEPDALARAAALWRGPFLADLVLDIEEFDAWRGREQERIAGAAARALESVCESADAAGDGERAVATAEQLVALDPTREDRQRVALTMWARHRGHEAALERAEQLASLLRSELDVAPDAKTRTLIAAIRNGEIALAQRPARLAPPLAASPGNAMVAVSANHVATQVAAQIGTQIATQTGTQVATQNPPLPVVAQAPGAITTPRAVAIWRRRPIAAAFAALSIVSMCAVALLGVVPGSPLRALFAPKAPASLNIATAVVLPFAVDPPPSAEDRAFARLLTHDLTADLARYGDLRIVADRATDLDPDGQVDVAAVGARLGVTYAVVGRVQRSDAGLRADVQLIDTATRMTLWSDHVRREGGDAAQLADEIARGFTHALVVSIVYAQAQRLHREPGQPAAIADLLLRARVAEIRGYRRENVAQAVALFDEVLRRAPNNAVAKLGIARMNIVATMNFIDLDPAPDLARAETLLNEVLERFPNWAAAHYTRGLLQKHRRQFDASLKSFQRSLELNPSFLHSRAQVGAVLTRMGQPEKGLEVVQEAIRLSMPNDPSLGFYYLFAGEAELELGHAQAALDWIQRASTYMPGSPLTEAWLAAVYAATGDQANAAKHVAALRTISPAGAERFADRRFAAVPPGGWPRTRILEGLRVALAPPAQ
jgi:DNA-binding SARP family transcriptional activator/TolB-like protein